MTDKVAELRKRAMELLPEGRAALASSLLVSLDENTVDEGAELEWEREIARRVDELKAGTVKTIPWAEIRSRVLARSMGRVAEVEFHDEATAEFDAATDWGGEKSKQPQRISLAKSSM